MQPLTAKYTWDTESYKCRPSWWTPCQDCRGLWNRADEHCWFVVCVSPQKHSWSFCLKEWDQRWTQHQLNTGTLFLYNYLIPLCLHGTISSRKMEWHILYSNPRQLHHLPMGQRFACSRIVEVCVCVHLFTISLEAITEAWWEPIAVKQCCSGTVSTRA